MTRKIMNHDGFLLTQGKFSKVYRLNYQGKKVVTSRDIDTIMNYIKVLDIRTSCGY